MDNENFNFLDGDSEEKSNMPSKSDETGNSFEIEQNNVTEVKLAEQPTDDIEKEPQNIEPTVEFETVHHPVQAHSNTGIKVFFSMIAVIVSLIIAVSAGYILGYKNDAPSEFNASTPVSDKNDASYQNNKTAVFNNVNPSVVGITVCSGKTIAGYASGVIYTSDGYIVTNDHIYSEVPSAEFLVTLHDGTTYSAEFVAGDTRSDLAVLKISAQNLTKATFGNYSEVTAGEDVISIGYPQGISSKAILTSGTVSSPGVRFSSTSSYSMKMIQTDAPINPGNSGGALVNMYSQVIGIPSVKMAGTSYDNVGYAIPSDTVVKVVDSLIKNGFVEDRGRLGITYEEINSATAKLQNIPTGLKVKTITDDSNLNGKGIETNDIITHINNTEITSSAVALDIIESTKPGEAIAFTVYHTESKKSNTVYASLLPDKGNSSYTNKVTDGNQGNTFENKGDDFFSDH